MNKQYVYVVFGQCGRYEDYTQWPVKAFLKRENAIILQDKLNQFCKDKGFNTGYGREELKNERPLEDINFQTDYTGTEYNVIEIELGEEV